MGNGFFVAICNDVKVRVHKSLKIWSRQYQYVSALSPKCKLDMNVQSVKNKTFEGKRRSVDENWFDTEHIFTIYFFFLFNLWAIYWNKYMI